MFGIREIVAAVAIAAPLLLSSGARAQIANGNFDTPGANFQVIQSWSKSGAANSIFDSFSPQRNVTFNAADDFIKQTITSTGLFVLSFYVKAVFNPFGGDVVDQQVSIQAIIRNSLNAVKYVVTGSGLTFGYQETKTAFDLSLVAGDTIEFTNAQFLGGTEFLRLDSVSFTAVPAPLAGAGLMSLFAGGVMLLGRVRRKASSAR